jgi:group I intron endonuclease
MKSGIYQIKNLVNGKIYIGQSLNVKYRLNGHLSSLKRNKHENYHLQNSFNVYGENQFSFSVIEYCEVDNLDEREKFWINQFKSMVHQNGYNFEGGGNENKIVSEETRQKKMGKNNPMYGIPKTEEWYRIIKIKNRANSDLLNEKDVSIIKNELASGVSQRELANRYKVTLAAINKIVKCKNWYWVEEHLNEKLIKLTEEKNNYRKTKVSEMWEQGFSLRAIYKETGVDSKIANKLIGTSRSIELAKRNEKIVNDFNLGLTKKQIMEKYKISSDVYVNVTHEAFNFRQKELVEKVREGRMAGEKVGDLAKRFNLHRTTVTEWTLDLSPRKKTTPR